MIWLAKAHGPYLERCFLAVHVTCLCSPTYGFRPGDQVGLVRLEFGPPDKDHLFQTQKHPGLTRSFANRPELRKLAPKHGPKSADCCCCGAVCIEFPEDFSRDLLTYIDTFTTRMQKTVAGGPKAVTQTPDIADIAFQRALFCHDPTPQPYAYKALHGK